MIAPKNHWAVNNKKIHFSDLINERFLMREPGSATRLVFENFLRDNNVQLRNTLQIESNEAIRLSVETGLGLAVISEHTLAQVKANIAIINIEGFPLLSHWYLVRQDARRLPIAAHQFIEFMDLHLAEWVEEKYVRKELGALLR